MYILCDALSSKNRNPLLSYLSLCSRNIFLEEICKMCALNLTSHHLFLQLFDKKNKTKRSHTQNLYTNGLMLKNTPKMPLKTHRKHKKLQRTTEYKVMNKKRRYPITVWPFIFKLGIIAQSFFLFGSSSACNVCDALCGRNNLAVLLTWFIKCKM